jgi:hypothetical protein
MNTDEGTQGVREGIHDRHGTFSGFIRVHPSLSVFIRVPKV